MTMTDDCWQQDDDWRLLTVGRRRWRRWAIGTRERKLLREFRSQEIQICILWFYENCTNELCACGSMRIVSLNCVLIAYKATWKGKLSVSCELWSMMQSCESLNVEIVGCVTFNGITVRWNVLYERMTLQWLITNQWCLSYFWIDTIYTLNIPL